MKICLFCVFPLCVFWGLTGCKQVQISNTGRNEIMSMGAGVEMVRDFNDYGDDVDGWFSKKGCSGNFSCYGYLESGKVRCYIRNLTNQHVLLNHKEAGPAWAIRFLDSKGRKWEGVGNDWLEYNFPHLIALGRINDGFDYSGAATSECVEFSLPKQCHKIVAMEIQLEYIPLCDLGACDSLDRLRKAFSSHKCRIPVEFNRP